MRHAIEFKVKAAARKDGTLVARKLEAYSNQGGYASHAHAIVANSSNEFKQIYKDEKVLESDAWTVYTNLATGGAMRGYGIPRPRLPRNAWQTTWPWPFTWTRWNSGKRTA